VFTFPSAIGSLCFVICNIGFPFLTPYEYKHSPDHPRREVLGSSGMLLLALLNVLSWLLVLTRSFTSKNPAALSIVLFDLTLLVYWWTSLSEKWKS
jgi:hypothetical protein